jgi:hypothetical protein
MQEIVISVEGTQVERKNEKMKQKKKKRLLKDVVCTRKISDIFKTSETATADSHVQGTTENVSSCSSPSECTTTPIFLAVGEDTLGKIDNDSAETLVCTESEVPSSTITQTLQYEDPVIWPGIITDEFRSSFIIKNIKQKVDADTSFKKSVRVYEDRRTRYLNPRAFF